MRRSIIFATFGLVVAAAASASKAQTLQLATSPFRETERNTARISGHLVTGVQLRSAPDDRILLRAYIPKDWAGKKVCSRVISADGLYEAANAYDVGTDWAGGMAELPHATKRPHMFEGRAPDEIGVRVSSSDCESDVEEATLAVSAWSDATEAPALLINSFQAEAVFAYVGGTPVRCAPIDLAGRSAYDTRCPLDGIEASGRVEVELLRIVGGNPAPSSTFFVWLP